jgi:hypothetical protein
MSEASQEGGTPIGRPERNTVVKRAQHQLVRVRGGPFGSLPFAKPWFAPPVCAAGLRE